MAQQELEILLKAKNITEEAFRAVERATADLEKKSKQHKTGFDAMRGSVNSFFKDNKESFSSLGQFMGLVTTGVVAVGGAVMALGVRGSTVKGVKDSFEALSASVGDTGDAILDVTRTATKGLISDMDVMAAVNKGILLGLPLTSKEMGTLASTAIVLGKAMQRGPTDALNDLITGLGRGSPLILDNLGITLDSALAYEKYGASIGKSSKDLTDAEKKIALYREATSAAAAKVAELGGIQLTFADRVTQGKVALGNLLDGMGVAVATSPAINRAFEVISGSITAAFGGNSQTAVKTLGDWVNKFALVLVSSAQIGLMFGKQLVQVWDLLKIAIAGVMTIIVADAEIAVTALGGIVSAAAKIPGIGDKFKGLSTGLENQRVILQGMRKDYQAQVGEAIDGAGKHKAAFESMSQGLVFLKTEMQKAVTTGKEYKAGAEEQARAGTAAGASATTASKAVKEWSEKAGELEKQLKLAAKHQAPLTTITEQYGSSIAEVVRQAQIMGLKVPQAIMAASRAINAAKLAEVMADIRMETAKLSAEWQETQRKGARAFADAVNQSLIDAVTAEKEFQAKRTEAVSFGVAGRLAAIERERREAIIALGEPPKGMEEQWRRSTTAINAYYHEMSKQAADQSQFAAGAFAGAARAIAGELQGIFGAVLEGAAMLVEGLVAATKDKFGGLAGFMNSKIGKTAVAAFQIGAEGFMSGYGAGRSMGRGRGALAGGIQGAMGGMAAGAMIGAAGGPIGMVGGALIGGAAGILGGLFGGGKKAAEEKAAAKELRDELVKTFGTMENLKRAADEFGISLDRAFSAKKPEEVQRTIDQLNAALAAKQARLEGISSAYEALGQRSDVFAKQAFGQIEAMTAKHEAELARAKAAGFTEIELNKLRNIHQAELTQSITAGAEQQIGAYQRIGLFASATIANQIKETGDLVGALDAAEGTLSILAQAEQLFGFEAQGAFEKIMQMREGVAVNRDVYDALSANTQMMTAFGQANMMTKELFNAFGADAGAQLQMLESRHGDMNLAMAAAQPLLQRLWEGQQRFGAVTDETTAKYLEQAEQQGLVGPQMQSVNQQILDVLIGIKDMLAEGIVGAFGRAATAGSTAAGTIGGAFYSARGAVSGFVDGAIDDLGRLSEYASGIEIGGDFRVSGGREQGYATGTMGVHGRWWENFGGGRPTMQHGDTAIIHPDQTDAFVADHLDYKKLAALMGGAAPAPKVVVQIGNRTIEDFILRTVNEGADNGRVATPARNVVTRL